MQPTRTKIVATLGPASSSSEMIRRMAEAGVDVFRLNFSHGTHESHAACVQAVRAAAALTQSPIAIMQDLQGPRIRTGRLAGGGPVLLEEGGDVVLRAGGFEGDERTVAVNYAGLADDVEPGGTILLCDGLIELTVVSSDAGDVKCRVTVGGELGERKGINVPGAGLAITAPTEKDLADLRFGIELGVDFVALSFVRTAADVLRLKEEIARAGGDMPVVAKIEKPEAVECLDEILQAADGVMVARGDLGIEMATESVPVVQKRIIRAANRMGVPAITATQMLESMVEAPRPTRAEASDVANAILDGTDAVMLSGETSVGRHPVAAVEMMDRIARRIESLWRSEDGPAPPNIEEAGNAQEHALARAACTIAEDLDAAGIVPFTQTGSTARYISQRRPDAPIYALTPDALTYRRTSLLWGVRAVQLDVFSTTDEMIEQGGRRLRELGLVAAGDVVVYVAGASTNTAGGTDMLKIHRFE